MKISARWKIFLPPSSETALRKAARELSEFFKNKFNFTPKIAIGPIIEPGISLALDAAFKGDGFQIKASDQRILISGPSGRAVFQGVFWLEDQFGVSPELADGLNRDIVFPVKERILFWDSYFTGQNKEAAGFSLEQHVREAVRLGYTAMECNRFIGNKILQQGDARDPYPWFTYYGPSMDQFVASPLFKGVFPKDYLKRNLDDLKRNVEVVRSYGLKPLFLGYEPRYVPEAFLKKRPDLRGPRVDHPHRSIQRRYTLCTDRKEVREHYRALARNLFTEVPDLEGMIAFFMDSGAGFCWAHGLYAGRNGPEHCRHVPSGERMSKFFMAIKQGMRDAGRDVPLIAQHHGITRPEYDDFFDRVPPAVEIHSGDWASWWMFHIDPLEVDRHVMRRQKESGRPRRYYQNHFFGFDVAPTAEFPLPFELAGRLKMTLSLNLDSLGTLGGIVSPPTLAASGMQEVYRQFLINPESPAEELVRAAAKRLGGTEGGETLYGVWRDLHQTFETAGRNLGFAAGTEYASRRTLVRPLVPESSSLSPKDLAWWLDFTFGGHQGFGHAHLFRGEAGVPAPEWYEKKLKHSAALRDGFYGAARRLEELVREWPALGRSHPYLTQHARQCRFLHHVFATGAHLFEGQALIDKYSRGKIHEGLRATVEGDVRRFGEIVKSEIENALALSKFLSSPGEKGMVILKAENTWGFTRNLSRQIKLKVELMRRHVTEADEVFRRYLWNL